MKGFSSGPLALLVHVAGRGEEDAEGERLRLFGLRHDEGLRSPKNMSPEYKWGTPAAAILSGGASRI
jgi:hypothetical protein